jgi:hypothetical protein
MASLGEPADAKPLGLPRSTELTHRGSFQQSLRCIQRILREPV